MFIDSELKKAFSLALLLHFLVLIVFNVNLTSVDNKPKSAPALSFYGSMLSDFAAKKTDEGESSFSGPDKKMLSFQVQENPVPLNPVYEKVTAYLNLEKPITELPSSRRIGPDLRVVQIDPVLKTDSFSKQDISAILDLKNLIFANFPFSESALGEDEKNLNFKMKVFISKEGKIEFAEPLLFSGNLELDMTVKKSIKEWSFLPGGSFLGWHEITLNSQSVNLAKAVLSNKN